jgi:hypothetical protein
MSAALPKLVLTPRVGSPSQSADTKAISAVESSGVVYDGPAVSVASSNDDGHHVIRLRLYCAPPRANSSDAVAYGAIVSFAMWSSLPWLGQRCSRCGQSAGTTPAGPGTGWSCGWCAGGASCGPSA